MAYGVNTTGPQSLTVAEIEQQLLSNIFGGTPFGAFMPMLTPYLNQALGLQGPGWRNPIMDTVLFSNQTPYGTYNSQLQNRFNFAASDALNRQSNSARRGWIENINRTMMSFDSWRDTDIGKQYAEISASEKELRGYYDDYIANKAAGQDGFLWGMGYKMFDPEGFESARNYLSMAGANIIRRGAVAGRRTAYLQAKAVGDMFLDENGKFNYKASDYGHMNIGETAAVTAALTTDTNLFDNLGADPADMRKAVDALKRKTQEFTKALSPLKDIFGSDIPAMITALENASGQRLSQMDPSRISALSARIATSTVVGGYTDKQITDMATTIAGGIRQMNVPYINMLGAAYQGMTVLDASTTGMAPAAMTMQRYQDNVGQLVMRTSNSQGAEYLNLAYAAWRDRNENGTFEEFQAEYNDLRNQYGADAAILRMGGASDFYALKNIGYQSQYYQQAVEQDLGGQIARTEHLNELIGQGYLQALGSQREDYMKAINAAQTDIRLLTDNTYLNEEVAAGRVTAEVAGQLRSIRHGYYGEQLVTAIHADAELRRKQPIYERQAKLRANLEALNLETPNSIEDMVNRFVKGEDLIQIVGTSKLYDMADPETQSMMMAVAESAQLEMKRLNITDPEKRKAFVDNYFQYGLENGYRDEGFTKELMDYEAAQKEMSEILNGRQEKDLNKEDRAKYDAAKSRANLASRGMYLSRFVDRQRLSEYVGDDEAKKQELFTVFDKAREAGATEEQAAMEVEDRMTVASIEKILGSKKDFMKGGQFGAIGKEFQERLEALQTNNGKYDAPIKSEDVFNIIGDLEKKYDGKVNSVAFEMMRNAANAGFGRESNAETRMEEFFGLISEAIKKMGDLSTDMQKVLDVASKQPKEDGE